MPEEPTDGNQSPDMPPWLAQAPDDLKGNEYLRGFPKMGEALKDLLEAKTGYESLKGDYEPMKEEFEKLKAGSEGMIKLPEDESGLDEILGQFAPENPEGYEAQITEEDSDKEFKEQFLQWAHEQKLPKSKTKALLSKFDEYAKTQQAAADESRKQALHEATKQLEERWGEKYDTNVDLADKGMKAVVNEEVLSKEGVEEMKRMINETSVGTSPAIMELFSVIGRLTGDDVPIEGDFSRQAAVSDGLDYSSMK